MPRKTRAKLYPSPSGSSTPKSNSNLTNFLRSFRKRGTSTPVRSAETTVVARPVSLFRSTSLSSLDSSEEFAKTVKSTSKMTENGNEGTSKEGVENVRNKEGEDYTILDVFRKFLNH